MRPATTASAVSYVLREASGEGKNGEPARRTTYVLSGRSSLSFSISSVMSFQLRPYDVPFSKSVS